MSRLEDAINSDRSNLTAVESVPGEKNTPPDPRLASLLKSPYARCPLPPSNNSADSLRQWGQGSDVPKFRTQTPPSNVSSGGGTIINRASITGSIASGSSTPATANTAQNASITTPSLAPSQTWTGSIQMSKGFMVLHVAASSFCRIELYGTKAAQTLDLSRPVTLAPSNTTSGLILDVALLTSLSWQVLDCVGANGDSPQSFTIYITVTNLSTAAQSFVVALQFVPQE